MQMHKSFEFLWFIRCNNASLEEDAGINAIKRLTGLSEESSFRC